MSGQSITLTGRSGTSYPFTVFPWGTEFNPVGGLYAALVAQNNRYVVEYIGQTKDLSSRPEDHHRESDFMRRRVCYVAVHGEANQQNRLAKEADLVSGIRPPLNRTAVE